MRSIVLVLVAAGLAGCVIKTAPSGAVPRVVDGYPFLVSFYGDRAEAQYNGGPSTLSDKLGFRLAGVAAIESVTGCAVADSSLMENGATVQASVAC